MLFNLNYFPLLLQIALLGTMHKQVKGYENII